MIADVLLFQLFANVIRDAGHIIHYRRRIFENVSVYLLMDVTDPRATLAIGGGVGFVDVADFERFGVENFAVDLKFPGDLLKLFFLVGHSGIKVNL